MSQQDNNAIIAALRRVGYLPEEGKPVLPASSPFIRRYWLVSIGSFSTVVDWRDATNSTEALKVAHEDGTQAWYVREPSQDTPFSAKEISRNEYIDWLKRGVK
jgi:hypothetical protein